MVSFSRDVISVWRNAVAAKMCPAIQTHIGVTKMSQEKKQGHTLRIGVQFLIKRLYLEQDLFTPPEDLKAEAVTQFNCGSYRVIEYSAANVVSAHPA